MSILEAVRRIIARIKEEASAAHPSEYRQGYLDALDLVEEEVDGLE